MRPEDQLPQQPPSQTPVDTTMPLRGSPALKPAWNRPELVDAQPATQQPQHDPDSRMAMWRGLLTDFVWSLGQGLEARGKNRRAGVGEALLGPYTLDMERRKMRQQEIQDQLRLAQENRTNVAANEAMNKIWQSQVEMPTKIQEMVARTAAANSQVPLNQARVGQVQAATGQSQAMTANLQAEIAQKQFVKVKDQVYRLSDLVASDKPHPIVDASADSDIQITVTKELADGIGQPDLAGRTVSGKEAKNLVSMYSTATKTTPTAGGVLQQNLITGEQTNLGAPAGVAVAQARPTDVIDSATGLPKVVSAGTAIATGATPGRLSDVSKLTGQAASFANFHSNANAVRELLPVIDKPGATTRIAAAMAQPTSTIGSWIQGQLATGNLTQQEYDLVNALATFREDIFNLRQFFGNSPVRSDRQVALMLAQVPSVADLSTGNSAAVERKIENFERSVHAVESQYGPLLSIIKNPKMAGSSQNQQNQQQQPQQQPPPAGVDFKMENGKLVPVKKQQ